MRKKSFFAACLLALALLAGCGPSTAPSEDDLQEDLDDFSAAFSEAWEGLSDDYSAKAHRWQILDAEGKELYTLSDEAAIAELDKLFQEDNWEDISLGGGEEEEAEEPLYTYIFWQEKTLLAGQDPDAEREYEEVLRFMIPAEGNTITTLVLQGLDGVQILDAIDLEELLTFRSVVPEETMEALRDPWRFA